MPHVITQSCCVDASCVVACPVNCIHPAPGEPGFGTTEMLYVDPRTCVGCGACVTACPVDAIKPVTALTKGEEAFVAMNAAYYEENPHDDRQPMALVPQQRRLRDRDRRLRVAVVGAGPAGLFTTDELLRHPEVSAVDIYDRVPTPYGLVRAGVAPDHQRTKLVEILFRKIESEPRVTYRLGVEVGRDVTDEELGAGYDAVIYTVGASADRSLGIPGEDLPGSTSATEVVAWYNGHPDAQDGPRLDHERVVVIGNGNVALDVARVLTADPAALSATDIAAPALDALAAGAVREVLVLGRRGPAQAAFTVPELVGLRTLPDVDIVVEAPKGSLAGDDPASRLLAEIAATPEQGHPRRIVLRFTAAPVRITGDGRVTGVDVARTRLVTDESGAVRAEPTETVEHVPAGLVLRSVGYRGVPVPGLPFDEAAGTVPHEQGRVRPGRYVAGWIKRGPRGFIGTNKACAQESVTSLVDDLDAGLVPPPRRGRSAVDALLAERGVQVVDEGGWRRIDAEERRRGEARGADRAKVVARDELLELAR